MSSKSEKEKQKQIQEKCQAVLSQLLRDEDNKYCVDCDAKGPRWASWNLGIFLCIRCAGIHRNLGVHISKVKSVNLDAWTPEQVACLQQMGNSRARAVYEANLPDNFRRPQTDSSLEAFIRAKYEQKKYIAKEWVAPPMPKPSIEFDEEKKKPKEKKAGKLSGLEVPLPSSGVAHKTSGSSMPTSTSLSSSSKKIESKDKVTSGGAVDLLGLNEPSATAVAETPATPSDDPFGRFLSADTSTNVVDLTTTVHNSESSKISNGQSNSDLEAITSQFGIEESQKKQQPLSKESILSLYSQGPPIPQQPPVIGMPGAIFTGQQPNMFGCPNIPVPVIGGMPTMPVMSGHMMTGMAISNVSSAVPQTHLTGTNPFFSSGSCGSVGGWFSATNPGPQPANFTQVHQQMASLNIGAPSFSNVSPHVQNNGWTGQQTGQTLSTNLWQ